jgi:hypothetical protein
LERGAEACVCFTRAHLATRKKTLNHPSILHPSIHTGLFGAPAPPPAGGLFGAPPAPGTGLFGGPPPAPGAGLFGAPPAGGGFGGFGGGLGAPPPPAAAAEEEEEEEEEEATPAALDAGAAIAFKAAARLHAMPPGAGRWVDRGRGVLTLREGGGGGGGDAGASSARPHIVFTTDTGRVLLNAALYKGLVTGKAKKPHMVTATLANAAAVAGEGGEGGEGGGSGSGAAPVLAPHLFSLGSEEEADAFSAALKEAVAKHCA